MPSGLLTFDLFAALPAELRLRIWHMTLEGGARLVAAEPRRDAFVCRSGRLPIISVVNQESRQEFLRLHTRLLGQPAAQAGGANAGPEDHVYLNPLIDSLVLGTTTMYKSPAAQRTQSLAHLDYHALGSLIDVPAMPRAAKAKIRDVRLHDFDFMDRVRSYDKAKDAKVDVDFQDSGVARLPRLCFPNLETIWVVTLFAFEPGFQAMVDGVIGDDSLNNLSVGVNFRYLLPSGLVYASKLEMAGPDLAEGSRSVRTSHQDFPDPPSRFIIRIDLQSNSSEPLTDKWTLLDGKAEADDLLIWHIAAKYVALRLRDNCMHDVPKNRW